MLIATGKLTQKTKTIIGIVLSLVIFLNLLDAALTFYAFGHPGVEEVGPLAGPKHTMSGKNVIGSTVFSLSIVLLILLFKLWRYRIVRIFLWIWLISEILVLINNLYWIYILLSPYSINPSH